MIKQQTSERDVATEVGPMTVQAPARPGQELSLSPVAEHTAWSTRGIKVLVTRLVAACAGIAVLWYSRQQIVGTAAGLFWAGVILVVIAALMLAGLTPL